MKKNSQLKPNHKIIKLILHNYFTPPFWFRSNWKTIE